MEVTELAAIRALTHPLRLDLLEVLARLQPATAAQCGRELGVPQANCSFHLRQLARFGFVTQVSAGADRRERRYRIAGDRPTVRVGPGEAAGGAAQTLVRQRLEQLVVAREFDAIVDHLDRGDDDDVSWRSAAGRVAAVVALDPDEVRTLRRQWLALLDPFLDRVGEPLRGNRRPVRIFMSATPTPALGDPRESGQPVSEPGP